MILQGYYEAKHATEQIGTSALGRHRRAVRLWERHLRDSRERLLDIGCGSGGVATYLQRTLAFGQVFGVDISEEAAARAQHQGVEAYAVNVDTDPLPFQDNFFDAILCSEVIEHLVDTDHLLDEIYRTLRPGGVAALTTPNLSSWINRLALLLGWQPFTYDVSLRHKVGRPRMGAFETSGHLHLFTFRALKELLELHDFRILELRGLGFAEDLPLPEPAQGASTGRGSLPPQVRLLLPLDSLVAKVPSLGFGIIAMVQKPGSHG